MPERIQFSHRANVGTDAPVDGHRHPENPIESSCPPPDTRHIRKAVSTQPYRIPSVGLNRDRGKFLLHVLTAT